MSGVKLGWLSKDNRSKESNEIDEQIVGAMPKFRIIGDSNESLKKILLTDFWKHVATVAALGFAFPRIHQLTGSCVGAGGGNMLFTLGAIEVIRLGDLEQIAIPFWPYTYGKSRQIGGMRGRGEGSFGSAYAKAAQEFGFIDARHPGLPSFANNDGIIYSEAIEMQWSDGATAPQSVVDFAKKHLVKSVSQCKTADDVRQSIQNGYPCTIAYSGYIDAGQPQVRGTGDEAVLMGDVNRSGGHQTTIQGFWEHPTFGEIFLYCNQWPKACYPTDPAGGPDCSTWITKRRMQAICDEGEAFAFSQFDGFPAQEIDKSLFKIM